MASVKWWTASLIALFCTHCVRAQDREEHRDLAKARFLCEWRHTTDGRGVNPRPLPFCETHQSRPIDSVRVEMDAWLDYFTQVRHDFDAEWNGSVAQTQEERDWSLYQHQRQLELERRAAQQGPSPGATSEQLCEEYRDRGETQILRELQRRGALSALDAARVEHSDFELGMSETALLCMAGEAEAVNRTVTAAGELKQYVYDHGAYVYVENGRVTGFQDRRKN